MQALIGGEIQSVLVVAGEPGDRLFRLEEEATAEFVAAGNLAFAGSFVEPAFPGAFALGGGELGDELVEAEQPPRRRLRGRDGLAGEFGREPGRQRLGDQAGEVGEQRLEGGGRES
jgi:hypothetical protein